MMLILLMLVVRAPWWLGFSWPQIVALMWAIMPVWSCNYGDTIDGIGALAVPRPLLFTKWHTL
jgi:hypothetical protein